jgi:ribosomal protein S18 acetylase RimI-like enzyme
MRLRRLTAADIDALHQLEAEAYLPALHESDDALLRLIALFPDGAIGAFDEAGMCGFIVGVPLKAGTTLELRGPLDAVPPDADVFYVHDIAVAGRCRGRGTGRQLAARLLDVARGHGFARAELVSVQGSAPFWERLGFRAVRALEYAPGAAAVAMSAAISRRSNSPSNRGSDPA